MSKQRYQNQISKWDLMQFLQLDYEQVQRLVELMASNAQANNVSIHLVMVAIILCQSAEERGDMLAKVRQIFDLVSFMVFEGQIQKTEVRYIYHLLELWISAVSRGRLPSNSTQHVAEIVQQQADLESKLFKNPDDDMASLDEVCAFIQNHTETLPLITLFQDTTLGDPSRLSIRTKVSLSKLQTSQLSAKHSQASAKKSSIGSHTRQDSTGTRHLEDAIHLTIGALDKAEAEQKHNISAARSAHSEMSHYKANSKPSEAGEDKEFEETKEDGASDATQSVQVENEDDQRAVTIFSGQPESMVHNREKVFGADLDLHWTNDVVSKVIEAYNTKLVHYTHDQTLLYCMQEKLSKYRDETFRITNSDRAANLKDLGTKLKKIEDANIEYYGHRQLPYMMKSFFFQQSLVNTGFSIPDYVTLMLQRVRATDDILHERDEDKLFEDVMSRAYVAQAFKEFYKQHLSQLKYELKTNNARLLHYVSQRGQQRVLEKKKYKTLGELCALAQMVEQMKKNESPEESRARNQRKVGKRRSTMSYQHGAHLNVSNTSIPTEAQVFAQIYKEVQKLRSCKMSRRDLVAQMDTKELRKTQANSISFWEGVLALTEQASQVRTFSQLSFFREFYEYGQRHLIKDEKLFKKTLLERQRQKQSFLTYSAQIGKIKGLAYSLNKGTEFSRSTARYAQSLTVRTKQLMQRLEKLDFALTNMVHAKIQRKRIAKSYFKSYGKLSAYSTIVKSLPCERIIDYLMIGMTKARTQEIIQMVAYQDRTQFGTKEVTQAQLLTAMHKIQTISTIDRAFNLDYELSDKEIEDPQGEFVKFQDELNQIAEMQRLMGEAPDHPVIDPLTNKEIKKDMQQTVATMLTRYYARSRIEVSALNVFQEFAFKKLKTPSFQLAGMMSFKTLDLDDAGKVLFDFIDIEDRTQNKTDDLISWMATLSNSLSQTYFHSPIEYLIAHSQEAHISCQKFAANLLCYQQNKYLGAIQSERVSVLNEFVTCLKGANRGHLLNNLDCQFMSLPLEYSLENNFWLAQALHMQLNYVEKDQRFSQMDQVRSPILLSNRSLSIKKNVAAQLILAAFDIGPQSVQGSENSDRDDDDIWAKDKSDYDKQFNMTKGENWLELKVKRYLFADAEEYLRMMKLKNDSILKIRSKYIQDDCNNKYKVVGKDNLLVLIRELTNEAYDVDQCGDVNEILGRYNLNKTEEFDKKKQLAVTGIIGGAKNFLDKIIKMQTKDNNIGQNQTLVKLQEFIEQIHDNISGKRVIGGGRGNTSNPTSPTVTGENQNSESVRSPLSRNTDQQISVNSGGTEVSYHGIKTQKSNLRKNTTKKKKKKEVLGLQQAEEELVNLVSKTKEIFQMIFDARNSQSTDEFFKDLSIKNDAVQRMNDKVNSTHQFLSTNCSVLEKAEITGSKAIKNTAVLNDLQQSIGQQITTLQLNADKLGCKIIQEVQAGMLVNPVFVFQPPNVSQLGMPPNFLTKFNETKEPETSTQQSPKAHIQSEEELGIGGGSSLVTLNEEVTKRLETNTSAAQQNDDPDRSSSMNQVDGEEEEAENGLNDTQFSSQKREEVNESELSEHQKAINFILQFIDQLSQMDDKITSKMLLRSDGLTVFIQQARLELEQSQTQLQIYESINQQQRELLNVFDLQVTPLQHYLKNFQRISKFVQRDMLSAIQRTDGDHLKVILDNVIARADQELIRQTVSRQESYYQNIEMDEHDKLDFLTAQVKIRRDLDQKLHTFKEYIDLEENKKASLRHKSLKEHQQTRINQEIASMQVIIRTYYLKQMLV